MCKGPVGEGAKRTRTGLLDICINFLAKIHHFHALFESKIG